MSSKLPSRTKKLLATFLVTACVAFTYFGSENRFSAQVSSNEEVIIQQQIDQILEQIQGLMQVVDQLRTRLSQARSGSPPPLSPSQPPPQISPTPSHPAPTSFSQGCRDERSAYDRLATQPISCQTHSDCAKFQQIDPFVICGTHIASGNLSAITQAARTFGTCLDEQAPNRTTQNCGDFDNFYSICYAPRGICVWSTTPPPSSPPLHQSPPPSAQSSSAFSVTSQISQASQASQRGQPQYSRRCEEEQDAYITLVRGDRSCTTDGDCAIFVMRDPFVACGTPVRKSDLDAVQQAAQMYGECRDALEGRQAFGCGNVGNRYAVCTNGMCNTTDRPPRSQQSSASQQLQQSQALTPAVPAKVHRMNDFWGVSSSHLKDGTLALFSVHDDVMLIDEDGDTQRLIEGDRVLEGNRVKRGAFGGAHIKISPNGRYLAHTYLKKDASLLVQGYGTVVVYDTQTQNTSTFQLPPQQRTQAGDRFDDGTAEAYKNVHVDIAIDDMGRIATLSRSVVLTRSYTRQMAFSTDIQLYDRNGSAIGQPLSHVSNSNSGPLTFIRLSIVQGESGPQLVAFNGAWGDGWLVAPLGPSGVGEAKHIRPYVATQVAGIITPLSGGPYATISHGRDTRIINILTGETIILIHGAPNANPGGLRAQSAWYDAENDKVIFTVKTTIRRGGSVFVQYLDKHVLGIYDLATHQFEGYYNIDGYASQLFLRQHLGHLHTSTVRTNLLNSIGSGRAVFMGLHGTSTAASFQTIVIDQSIESFYQGIKSRPAG